MNAVKILNADGFNEIKRWVHQNARPLELALWQFHFERGSQEGVLSALSYYQNKDGGFGEAIEPDNWNPESTPYATDFALSILRQIGFTDVTHPLYQGIFNFLKSTAYRGNDGWFFTVPTNDGFPRATWWKWNDKENAQQNIGTTANLSGFILRYTGADTELYAIAEGYADMLIKKLTQDGNYGDMGVFGFCSLYKDLSAAGLDSRFDVNFLEVKTRALIKEHFHEYKWSYHQDMASALPEPSVYYYDKAYANALTQALDELIDIRPSGGVWGIPWHWYDEGVYAREFAISENWWKSYKAIEKLLFLKNHGRICIQ